MGVSFVAIFIVAYHIVFWVLGAAHSLSWDFLPNVPQGEAAERRVSWKEKPIGGWVSRVLLGHTPVISEVGSNTEVEKVKEKADDDLQQARESNRSVSDQCPGNELLPADTDSQQLATNNMSRVSIASFRSRPPSAPALPNFRNQDLVSAVASSSHISLDSAVPPLPESSTARSTTLDPHESKSQFSKRIPSRLTRILRPLSAIITPITLTLSVSLPIALIQPLKALFVDTTQMGGPNWKGPDGRPPLNFVIDAGERLTTSGATDTPFTPLNSLICGRYHGAHGFDSFGCELCAHVHSTPYLSSSNSRHACCGIC